MHKNNLIPFIIILGLLQPAAAFCETITLKSGKQIEGRIMEKTDQYIKIESDGSPIYYELKYVQNIEENKRDAKFYLTKTLEANPDDAEVYSIIGTSYYLSGQSQLARENLNKARELFQKNNDYLKAKDIEEFLGTMK